MATPGKIAIHGAVDWGIYLSDLKGDGKQVFQALWDGEGASADEVIEKQGLKQESDSGAIEALIDGVIDLVIETPIRSVADTAVSVLLRALQPGQPVAFGQPFVLPFELYTPENV